MGTATSCIATFEVIVVLYVELEHAAVTVPVDFACIALPNAVANVEAVYVADGIVALRTVPVLVDSTNQTKLFLHQ